MRYALRTFGFVCLLLLLFVVVVVVVVYRVTRNKINDIFMKINL